MTSRNVVRLVLVAMTCGAAAAWGPANEQSGKAATQQRDHSEQGVVVGSWDRVGELAELVEASEYSRVERGRLDAGWLVRLGQDGLFRPEAIDGGWLRPGIYVNISGADVLVSRGGFVERYPDMAMVVVGEVAAAGVGADTPALPNRGVHCRDGYYACCNDQPRPSARCIANSNNNAQCQYGGPGSDSCAPSGGR